MLIGENCRRRKNCDLFAVHDGLERRPHGDLGLAVADISDNKPVHRDRGFHVALHIFNCGGLVNGKFEGKRIFEFMLPWCVGRESVTRDQLSLGVEPQELVSHITHRSFSFRFCFLPADSAKPVKRDLRIFAGRKTRN